VGSGTSIGLVSTVKSKSKKISSEDIVFLCEIVLFWNNIGSWSTGLNKYSTHLSNKSTLLNGNILKISEIEK
jgi:hypothetical protein